MCISAKKHLAIGCLFAILTVVMTYPLITMLDSGIIGWEGDNTFYVWQLSWFKHALVDLHISPFHDPFAYYPFGYETAHGETTPANSLLFLPLTVFGNAVISYNCAVLFAFWGSAIGAYLWVWQLSRNRIAAIVAGTIFGFLPYRFAHMPGHLELVTTQWIPLSLFCFEWFLASKHLRWAAVTGLSLSLLALAAWYYAYSAALLLPIYVLMRSRPWHEHLRQPRWWLGIGLMIAISMALVIPFALPYYQLSLQGQLSRDYSEMERWSLNVYDFFIPNLLNPWWGATFHAWFPQQAREGVERTVSLGYVALGFALIGLSRVPRIPWLSAAVALWIVSFLIALGPTLHFEDRQVQWLSLPFVPLPSYFLYWFSPFANSLRVMIRFGVWTGLMTAALAGVGTSQFLDKLRLLPVKQTVVSVAIVTCIVCAILFESNGMLAGSQRLTLRPRPVDLWLSGLANSSPDRSPILVIELPVAQTVRPLQNYYLTVHQQATVLGPSGDSFAPPVRLERTAILRDFPSAASLAALKSWHVTYVLFTSSQIPDWNGLHKVIEATRDLIFDRIFEDIWVYRVNP